MESNRYGFLVNIYLLLTVVHLFLLQTNLELYQHITKVLLMPVLLVYAYTNTEGSGRWPLVAALLLGWAGDTLLIFSARQELYFLLGLGAFLLGHLAYIRSFVVFKDGPGKHQWTAYLGLIAVVSILMSRITPYLGDMRLPVFIYVAAISAMTVMAIRRKDATNNTSYYAVLIGALCFIASDYLIAWNKFYAPVPNSAVWIMLTYAIAQYLIVQGLLWHKKNPAG
jgi:uncharacterized membrane protein YhhN